MHGLVSLISHWSVNYLTMISFSWLWLAITPPLFFSASLCVPRTSEKRIFFPWISHGVWTNMALFPQEMYQHHCVYFSTALTSRRMGQSNWTFGWKNLVKDQLFQSSVWAVWCFSWVLGCLASVDPAQTPKAGWELWAQCALDPSSSCPKGLQTCQAPEQLVESSRGAQPFQQLHCPGRRSKDKALPLWSLGKAGSWWHLAELPHPITAPSQRWSDQGCAHHSLCSSEECTRNAALGTPVWWLSHTVRVFRRDSKWNWEQFHV